MKCKRIREIIITDYIDNELDEQTQKEIESHLNNCDSCRVFKKALMTTVVEPLRNSEAAIPPDILWSKIRNNLEQGKNNNNSVGIGNLLFAFRPRWINIALVISMLLIMIFAGNYFAASIWSSISQQDTIITVEFANNLELHEFNDIPNEQVEQFYNNIVGG